MFGDEDNVTKFNPPNDAWELLEESIVRDRTKTIFTAIINSLQATEYDLISKNLVYILHSNNCTLEFLNHNMTTEISQCDVPETIFRGNSIASRMFKTYSRLIGLPFLFDILARYIQQLEALNGNKENLHPIMNINVEVDENKVDNQDLETNSLQLQFVCNKILTSIISSSNQIPREFRVVFDHVKTEVEKKFEEPAVVYNALGGLYFLRFVIPSIFLPHIYGLIPEPPSDTTQRQLTLIAKVLQSIANLVLPGKKEQYMIYLERFIGQSIPKMKQFYQNMHVALAEMNFLRSE